jgi:phospholipid/cholesterol/gamma-HCH transport system permease protein
MMVIGTNSIPIVILTSIFSGMVTSVQSAYQFESWTPAWFVGSIVGESILLELAPVISALVLTGRVGATIAAEIGTMRVTEQIDAIVAPTLPVKTSAEITGASSSKIDSPTILPTNQAGVQLSN